MRYCRLVALLLQALVLLFAAPAQAAPTHIGARLVAESAVAPGQTVELAMVMRPDAGWHGYWSNPGDAGLGMQLDWRTTAGTVAGTPRYPVPEVLLIKGLMNHVYAHDYAVLVPFSVPRDARPGAVLPVAVDAQWLACTEEICVPERARLEASVTVVAPGTPVRPDPRFDTWRQRMPAPLGAEARFTFAGGRLRLAIPLPASVALHQPHLFLEQDKVIDYAAVQAFSREGDTLVIEMPRAKFAAIQPGAISGVLRLARDAPDGLAIQARPGTVPPAGMLLAGGPANGWQDFALLLLGALAGGLLLNVMPCVFPILSLKALSLARSGESKAGARAEGLAYGAGVVVACLSLGALLLGLRAAGQEVGWAFQLQEPLVVAALLLLATALTANFLGVFEFGLPGFASSGSTKGAFSTGLLAAFVATPCTGPFMAAAMGAALLLPVVPALALFAALGLGIAMPFLAIAFIPALRRLLPKPGPWMVSFRRWMALPMGLTALALLWLASRTGGWFFAGVWLAIAVAVIVQLVLVGAKQRRGEAAGKLMVLEFASLVLGGVIATPHILREPASAAQGLLPAQEFSEAALVAARGQGKPVFAWFTADWCLTCKVNEQVAIERAEVLDAFARAGVVVLRGDWTRRDPAITRFLTAQGAAGVPLYLWYPAGGGAPQQLPQVLTPGMLTERAGGNRQIR